MGGILTGPIQPDLERVIFTSSIWGQVGNQNFSLL